MYRLDHLSNDRRQVIRIQLPEPVYLLLQYLIMKIFIVIRIAVVQILHQPDLQDNQAHDENVAEVRVDFRVFPFYYQTLAEFRADVCVFGILFSCYLRVVWVRFDELGVVQSDHPFIV